MIHLDRPLTSCRGTQHWQHGPFPFNMTTPGYIVPSMAHVYNGTNPVSYGVSLVTINYRLSGLNWFKLQMPPSKTPCSRSIGPTTISRLLVVMYVARSSL